MTKRLSLKQLEEWKRKAHALDQAVKWMEGRIDSDAMAYVDRVLRSWNVSE